jgi:hypothetical protein
VSETIEACPVCGFVWDDVDPATVPARVRAATSAMADVLRTHPTAMTQRPSPERWSGVEYACHVRDVCWNLRDRIVLGAVEDVPTPHGLHTDNRIAMGLYARDTPEVTAGDLVVAGDVVARTMECLPPHLAGRTLIYGWPRVAERTLHWVAAQLLHECEHHLDDVRENVTLAA